MITSKALDIQYISLPCCKDSLRIRTKQLQAKAEDDRKTEDRKGFRKDRETRDSITTAH